MCLLLGKREEAWSLLQELQTHISSYGLRFSPPDAADWQAVAAEVAGFLSAGELTG